MLRAVALRDEPGIGELVEALLEADRERPQWLGRFCCEGGEHGGVDPAREEHADRDVGHEMSPHGVAQACTQLFDEVRPSSSSRLRKPRPGRGARIGSARPAVLPSQMKRLLELSTSRKIVSGCRTELEREKCFERVEVDLTTRQRPQLGCEGQLVRSPGSRAA